MIVLLRRRLTESQIRSLEVTRVQSGSEPLWFREKKVFNRNVSKIYGEKYYDRNKNIYIFKHYE